MLVQIPGFAELLIVVLILFLLAIPVALVVGLLYYVRRRTPSRERIDRLESEVEALREELGSETDGGDPRR